MEFGSIEREIYVEAAPELVYDVVSSPEHLREWWPDDIELDPAPGGAGRMTFGRAGDPDAVVVPMTVVDAERPHRFSFRWAYEEGEVASSTNSYLATFEITPSGTGTLLRLTEIGFRERGWEAAVLEERYQQNVVGWAYYLPRLVSYAEGLVSPR
ncbi:SRPBCC domain-containing protein [Actinotalea fermentans]|uniref:Activator of HSP90 ATPase n=1 Tax=Actinotalea fermentans TaxID=43671 RepID=A0A511YX96_9CELL|nr:SRPBCC domain-containing protein [Actinotalea fermentans]KGM16697.1 polyketide cyclase [Actinotalea fermentans ATCC 43279 = JCM 9966 = DSM 3133]GEN79824.1 activator of HSP90 ATPase [Actinotalea fermentans]